MPTDADAAALVARLDSLRDGPSAVAALIAFGPGAIPALRSFLLCGKTGSVPEPRRWAVEALAGLGAKDVLWEFLEAERHFEDAVLSFSEETVENSAARALAAHWPTDDVFELLQRLSRDGLRSGFIEAIATFKRVEAAPLLVRALEDDACRTAAEDGLAALGAGAHAALVEAALSRSADEAGESPSSLRRRRSAARLLARGQGASASWMKLRPLLEDGDAEVAVQASRLAIRCGGTTDRKAAVDRLLSALPHSNAVLHTEIEDALQEASPELAAGVSRRTGALPNHEHGPRRRSLSARSVFSSLLWMVATGFGSGHSPVAPGTAGSLVGLILFWFVIAPLAPSAQLGWSLCATALGIVAAAHAAERTGLEDPAVVVVDEVVGMWISLVGIPLTPLTASTAFVLFRVLDVLKPFPARQSERLPGGWGIMADDVIVAVYTNLIVRGASLLLGVA